MNAIYRREMKAYFTSPVAYIVIALMFFWQARSFMELFTAGQSQISLLFSTNFILILFVIPFLTMRLISEEKRQKTEQLLLTAPVKLTSIVMGKFFATLTVFGISLSISIIFEIILNAYITMDWILFLANFIGTLLLAAALIGLGEFVSSLTESQALAAAMSIAISLLLLITGMVTAPGISTVLSWIAFMTRFQSFVNGELDYSNVLFFVSVSAVFLFLTVRVLDKKRWA